MAEQDVGQALAFGGSSTIGLMVGGLKLLGRWGSPTIEEPIF